MDVFISYQHESKSIADNICSVLESRGVKCWYAPRDVSSGGYAASIVEAIEKCKVFVLILNDQASSSPHVLNEVEMAYQRILEGEITIVPFKVDESTLSKTMEYYVKRLHWIDAVSESLETAIDHLYDQLKPILGIKDEVKQELSEEETNIIRKNLEYYSAEDRIEKHRLAVEDEFLYEIEKPLYNKLFFSREHLNALSFGTLNPNAPLRRLNRPEVDNIAVFSYADDVIENGNAIAKDKDHQKFFKMDYEKSNIEEALQNALDELGIDGFDFVDLSLTVMDMKNPFRILKKIKKFMKPDAVAFICDVDDGVVFTYPDEHGYFEEFKEFYKLDTLSGARNTGRQIYAVLKKLGAKEIKLEKTGINTSNMDYADKRKLFECWFGFIPNDFNLMLKENPNNETALRVKDWLDEYFDDIEENFYDSNTIFNAGYIMYTVRF